MECTTTRDVMIKHTRRANDHQPTHPPTLYQLSQHPQGYMYMYMYVASLACLAAYSLTVPRKAHQT